MRFFVYVIISTILLQLLMCSGTNNSVREPIDGAELFEGNCADCHAMDLRKKKNGPALGNIHQHRTREWLYRFILDSQAMVKSGDPLARCVFNANQQSIMSAFKHLSKTEIMSILDYLEAESKKQNIKKGEVLFPNCD